MTLRDSSDRNGTPKGNLNRRLRKRLRRKDRRLLSESLEQRQLLAGPDLIGIQPNEGSLLNEGTVLSVSPRELVFQFDDNADIDPSTLSAIQITRAGDDGVFESASATSDLGTNGALLVEFRAVESGSVGNGITVQFTSSFRTTGTLPLVSVADQAITIDVNNNSLQSTRVGDLVSAVQNNPLAADLIEVIQVSGSSLSDLGTQVPNGLSLTLVGANAAEAVTDFGTNGDVGVRFVSQLSGEIGRSTQLTFEQRDFGGAANPVVLVTGQDILIQLNSSPGFETTAQELIDSINTNPQASVFVLAAFQDGNVNTPLGGLSTVAGTLNLSGVSDVAVEPGFVGLGDSAREVVFRFAEPLPDDLYQIDILGSGPVSLRNTSGDVFQNGVDLSRQFNINLGPQVAAVVPEPVRRNANGELLPEIGRIEVHFNNDSLDLASAQNPNFYQLVFTQDTVGNTDDIVITPETVTYSNITNIATLDFERPLSRIPHPTIPNTFLEGAARLRVGSSAGLPDAPTDVSLVLSPSNVVEPGDTFDSAFDLNSQLTLGTSTTQSAVISSEIFNTQPFELDLPGPDLPGTRNIRPDDPSRLDRTVPLDVLRNGADTVDGISVIQYNFPASWVGQDPNAPDQEQTFFSVISEQQKERVREAIELFSEYLGVSFVEVEGEPTSPAFFSIVVGDLFGGDVNATSGQGGLPFVSRDTNGDGIDDLGVLDFQDFDESIDDQFGGEFFRGGLFAVGQLLGYGFADDLPQPVSQSTDFIFSPGEDNELIFPSVVDIVHGQFLFRPDSTDVDLYRFTLDGPGTLTLETIAERLETASLLDSVLQLYQLGPDGSYELIAQNDDYFSRDSSIGVDVDAGTYVVGVSAGGNTQYDPNISSSGFGGLTEGEYELRLDFRPDSTNGIVDTTGVALDGDNDDRPGGVFDFWFVPADINNTLYVDKGASSASGLLGSVGNPYREIDQAIAAANPGDTVRVVGNGGIDGLIETAEDNFSYQIGIANNGLPLEDGASLDVPQGVRLVIDSGAILKLSGTRIGVGSVLPSIDASDSSLQVLGTPSIVSANGLPARDAANAIIPGNVIFTSINDNSVGNGNSSSFGVARPGDWGGIDFRGDLDAADESRRNRELEGVFLNHVQFADLRFGGGSVSIGGQQVVVSPIDIALTRPTIINSRITDSADAAIAATPDSFAETRFTEPFYQAGAPFTPDFERVGPDISGNTIIDNSINGLFIRVVTRTGTELETVSTHTRFDDTDITHVLTETLVIEGTAGGPILQSSAPSSLLVRGQAVAGGSIPAGTYQYRITNLDATGIESASSQPTIPVSLTSTGGIQLDQLPVVGDDGFTARRLYRASVNPLTGLPGEFRLVASLNASDTSFIDTAASGTSVLSIADTVLRSRLDARLAIDPGTVLKIDGARIEARFGANLIAEGSPSLPIVFTSLEDQRYGTGGTFDTNGRGNSGELTPGDWGGLYIGHAGSASIDHAVIAGGGGATRVEGGFASFNAIEVQQGTLRLANTRLDQNASGVEIDGGDRVGRGTNEAASVFVRAAAPIIVDNEFVGGQSVAVSIDLNSFSGEVFDPGRSTGLIDRSDVVGNTGPLLEGNVLENNTTNGLQVRGGQLITSGVFDDVDIVHVVNESIDIPNQHIFGGLRLESDARGSLVVKFESDPGETAGIVVGGTLATAADEFRDIPDRIGGSLQVIGHPDFPVVLTTLADDTVGAGFTLEGLPQLDTNNDGILVGDLDSNGNVIVLPTGPEVDQGTTIDNDVDVNTVGHFEATIGAGNSVFGSGVTVEDVALAQVLVNQDFVFAYTTYVTTSTGVVALGATTITQPATLIANDMVESRGTFTGPGGIVNWIATSSFQNGVTQLVSQLQLDGGAAALGAVQVVSYLDEDIDGVGDDILVTTGTPGAEDFRAFTIDGPRRIGFAHGGVLVEDGIGLANASFAGWAADQFNQLEVAIIAGTQAFSVPGEIDLVDLPQTPDPDFGVSFGPNDVTTAFAWDVDPTATTATVTSFLELLAQDPAISQFDFEPGLWNGIVIREGADDRNVAGFVENEPVRASLLDTNAVPSQSQFLGEIAPNLQSGDENRRLGFVVDGSISTRDDLDVYSFVAESGTEVFLDIDLTGNQLDSVVELIDANGRVLASSNDSLLAETDPNALFTGAGINSGAAQSLSVGAERVESQEITITESIVGASGGSLSLQIAGSIEAVQVPVVAFLEDPAGAVQAALEAQYPEELGQITASLLRRAEREVDPNNPALITRVGDDFVIQLRFDETQFVGRSVPLVSVDTSGVVGAVVNTSVREVLLGSQLQDDFSTNPKDAGLRIQLPGEAGTRNLYHVRVRSSNTRDPLDFNTLTDPAQVRDGLSLGNYQLQIRLQEADERSGTQIRLAEVRFATTGLQIIGQPLHSPLLGEEQETTAPNDTLATAQPLGLFSNAVDEAAPEAGGPLQSDQLAVSFAGSLDSATDVDWYQFTINYDNLTRDEAALYLSTVFDLDYASGFARADTALYVFNAAGNLILIGGDSNVADDLPGTALSNDTGDLSRGSAGTEDPFIGAAELLEGTYFVAVSNQQQVPAPLDQFFNANTANPLLRLEPIDSVTRIAEDRIGSSGGGTAGSESLPLLFDDNSIVDFTLDDAFLYVNTGTSLELVNPFTGEVYGSVGNLSEEIRDVAFRANGELFGFTENNPPLDASTQYVRIETGDATVNTIGGLGLQTFHLTDFAPANMVLNQASNDGIQVEGVAIAEFLGSEDGFFVGNRPIARPGLQYTTNVLFDFNEVTGAVTGPGFDLNRAAPGAGTTIREVGQINTAAPAGAFQTQLGISEATELNAQGIAVPVIRDGDTFTLSNVLDSVTFEFDQGFTIEASVDQPVRDGDTVTIDGVSFEVNSGSRLELSDAFPLGILNEGVTVTVQEDAVVQTFEFVRSGLPAVDNIPISITDAQGTPLDVGLIASALANAINQSVPGLGAEANGSGVFFADSPVLTTAGAGVLVVGDSTLNDPDAIEISLTGAGNPEELIESLANAIRDAGIAVLSEGTQLSLPNSNSVLIEPDPLLNPSALMQTGTPGMTTGNVAIPLFPTDTVDTIARRIVSAVQTASDDGDLPNVAVIPDGQSLNIAGGFISETTGNLVAGGVPLGGTITGIEIVNDELFAVSDAGGFYQVSSGELNSNGNRTVGRYVQTATDLIGINFSSLRSGPVSVEDGTLDNILFGLTSDGDIYAFNTRGELQPVFAGGLSVISTGIDGALGLDFGVIDFNLWHVTDTRANDAGHGIDALDNGTRAAVGGGSSLAFNFEEEAFGSLFPSVVEQPGFAPRLDGTSLENSFNLPGGARGAVQSNAFSLEGFASDDEPTLYFNYFSETDGNDDRLRVYVATESGVEHLVASNSTDRLPFLADDEFDDPAPIGIFDDDIDVDVQQLFDNTGAWRQARIPLGEFAGEDGLSLRIEFSTNGSTATNSTSIRTLSGAAIEAASDRSFTVANEQGTTQEFTLDLAPVISFPSGSDLATQYVDPDAATVLTLDGQDYVLNDGTRLVDADQISIDLFATNPGVSLTDLTASEIANTVAAQIQVNLPPNPTIAGFDFSDPQDDPSIAVGRNDFLFEATQLPYDGGNLTITGAGRLGIQEDPNLPPSNVDDVDLLRVEVTSGTVIDVDVDLDFNAALDAVVRFFDGSGNELASFPTVAGGSVQHVAATDGVVFIGISGLGNDSYDPITPGTAQPGQVDSYTASVSITEPTLYQALGNRVEIFGGSPEIAVAPTGLLQVTESPASAGISIPISRLLSNAEVALEVQQALANRFFDGNTDPLLANGGTLGIPSLSVLDSGPFVNEADSFGDTFASSVVEGARDNNFEGVYLDDFIIGFAERGEVATGSNVVSTPFVTDGRPQFPTPADPTTNLVTGTYQVEIRGASEFVNSLTQSQFRTFDTNDRLSDSRSITAQAAADIQDGSTFSIADGQSAVVFEFDLVESGNGVTPGNVPIPFSFQAVEPGSEQIDPVTGLAIPGTGSLRPQTAAEVAQEIVQAINRSDVQALIDVPALLASGVDSTDTAEINLFGDVVVESESGGLASVERNVLTGDSNTDRVSQGVILIESSTFLFNEEYGIRVSHGLTAEVAGMTTNSVVRNPRNLVELNTENFATGVVIQSNLLAFNEVGGLRIDGIPVGTQDTANDPVPFDRIVNNTIVGGSITSGAEAPPETFQGVLFDEGVISFADTVVEFLPDAGGAPPAIIHQVSTQALGAPDSLDPGAEPIDGSSVVSLGLGGSLTVQFTDNLLSGSGDAQPDLVVFETGGVESVRVEISRDGLLFQDVGILGGLDDRLDIDQFGFGTQDRFAFVRLTDLRQGSTNGTALGADIDAIGALSSVPVDAFTAGGVGIDVTGNAAPVLLNNIVSNSDTGIQLDATNTLAILGGNTFYRNTTNVPAGVSPGEFVQELADAEVIFVDPAELVFSPAAGASTIDSSIDSLEDRASLTTVRNPLGLPPSPILAPDLDVNGQLRVDDPNVETPSGLGERVFGDRGASDRGDLVGPRVVLSTPQAPNLGLDAGVVSVFGDPPPFFEVQLIDGLAPADIVPGSGIDDQSISSGSILLLQDNEPLIEGVDYRFGYNPSTNVIRLTPIAGAWEQDSTYVIRLIDATDAIVQASAGSTFVDGGILNVNDVNGETTRFEYETGIIVTVNAGAGALGVDGSVLEVFDGTTAVTFELDNDLIVGPGNVAVTVPVNPTDAQVAEQIAVAIRNSGLNLSVNVSDETLQLLGTNPLASVTSASAAQFNVAGTIGTEIGFGIQVPFDGAAVADTLLDGQTFVVRRGVDATVTFELSSTGLVTTPGATPVPFIVGSTLDQVADAIVREIGGAGLGLDPINVGFGRIALGGDGIFSLDLTNSGLLPLGISGQEATIPILVDVASSEQEIASVIADTITTAGLAGVSASVVDSRVFLEGTLGISGIGSVETITVRDEVGNLLQSNQADGRTELAIFIGGGQDFGDAPSPFPTTEAEGGPRHTVDETFALAPAGSDRPVTVETDAIVPDGDSDNGVFVSGLLQPGFDANLQISVLNETPAGVDREFFVDAWFDWNANGVFEVSEAIRFGSPGSGRSNLIFEGTNIVSISVPSSAVLGETFARFRLSEAFDASGNLLPGLSPVGDAPSGEVEDIRLLISNNPFQNPEGRFDVNQTGVVTPLDALQIINAIGRNDGNNISLDLFPLPDNLPAFPDVSGDGVVTALDALQVINELARLPDSAGGSGELVGEGESVFVPVASGVLASSATFIGDALIADAQDQDLPVDEAPAIVPTESKTSVFDSAAVVELDSIVDSLAEDTASVRADEDNDALDQLFASL